MSGVAIEMKFPEKRKFFINCPSKGEAITLMAHDFRVEEGFLKFTCQEDIGVRICAVFRDWDYFMEIYE